MKRIPSLDGLRAISIALVILNHLVKWKHIHDLPLPILGSYGNLGVHIFFVISGYLITSLLLREHQRTLTISLRDFYIRRAFRIFPAALVFIAVAMVLDWNLFLPHVCKERAASARSGCAYAAAAEPCDLLEGPPVGADSRERRRETVIMKGCNVPCAISPCNQAIRENKPSALAVVCFAISAKAAPRTPARQSAVCTTRAGSFGRLPRKGSGDR